jgi:hypothetical protein
MIICVLDISADVPTVNHGPMVVYFPLSSPTFSAFITTLAQQNFL